MRASVWQGDVLANRSLHQQRLCPVGRDVDDARSDGVGGMAERRWLAVDQDLAASWPGRSCEDVEQLVLTLTLQRHHTDDLTGTNLERDVVQVACRS